MYLNIFLILSVSTLTYRLAHADGRSGLLWGLIGLLIAIMCFQVIAQPILAALAGIVSSILIMTLANIWFPAHKRTGLNKEKQ